MFQSYILEYLLTFGGISNLMVALVVPGWNVCASEEDETKDLPF